MRTMRSFRRALKDYALSNSIKDKKVRGIECLKCHSQIWSKHRHDFVLCKCEAVAVDGGREYLRVCGEFDDWKGIDIVVED